jgi:hemolysin activation/secretion protein
MRHSCFVPSSFRLPTILFPLAIGFACINVTHAQAPAGTPDAGALQREAERSLHVPRSAERSSAVPAARPMADDAKAVRVSVKGISITGASLIPVNELEPLVADRIGQSLTLAELEHAAQRIAEHYRQRGWFVRVYLPQQDVTDGHVRIQVLEGRYGGSRLENKGKRASADHVRSVVTHRLSESEALSAADLERGLLLANDLPGIAVTGLLEAGAAEGETRLAMQLDDTPFVTGDLGVNNHGVKATGRAQVVGGIALNNLSGRGDQLSLRALAAADIASAQARYSLPLGYDGLRLAAHASTLAYELGDRYKQLDADGKAHTAGLTLSHPLLRQTNRNLNLSAAYEYRRYDDDMLDAALRRHRVDAVTLGLDGDRRDALLGGGITWGRLELTHGRLYIRDIAGDRAADAAGPRSRGDFSKLAFHLNRLQAIGAGGWQIHAALSGQIADRNLGSSERFTLGGPNRVRAYPVNEASGDEGLLLKLELQRNLSNGWQAIAFYDSGRIRQHKHTWAGWDGASGQPNSYSLSGGGIGLNWRAGAALGGWQLAASAAFPIDGNPGADARNRNNDGSKAAAARYWLNLNRAF